MKIILIIFGVVLGVLLVIFLVLAVAAFNRRPKFTRKGFTPLERNLIEEFCVMFSPDIQEKIRLQVKYFEGKRKWRQYWGKSMTLELYDDKEVPLPENAIYARKDEGKIATIRFSVNRVKYSIEFKTYDGRIWGWAIRPNPKKIQKGSAIEISSKKINNDPAENTDAYYEKKVFETIPAFQGILLELQACFKIMEANHPLRPAQRQFFEKNILSKLPPDYLSIIEQAEGISFDQFRILGISEIQDISLDDGNYNQLIEFDDGSIAVKEGNKKGDLFYLHHSGQIDQLGTDLELVIRKKSKDYLQ
ncbi:hypothetical protein [Dawidia soli]|uniref:Uncharacterized protein n=1 Tax=Dawidia soli TaxID=2782352 RepID=A0AAP2GH84_9BACT|nr:hypothetical protein [Dawidia soli]MBT1686135.1 hypothetical protein [Dawidia soli]